MKISHDLLLKKTREFLDNTYLSINVIKTDCLVTLTLSLHSVIWLYPSITVVTKSQSKIIAGEEDL